MNAWSAVVDVARARGPVEERRSRYTDKAALWLHGREIAHCEAPGVVDLRITARGWRALPDRLRADPRRCPTTSAGACVWCTHRPSRWGRRGQRHHQGRRGSLIERMSSTT